MYMTAERIIPKRLGRPPKYPWDKWLDGEIHVVEQDIDFRTLMSSFVMMIHQAAKREDGTAQTSTEGKKITFVFIPNAK